MGGKKREKKRLGERKKRKRQGDREERNREDKKKVDRVIKKEKKMRRGDERAGKGGNKEGKQW